MALVAPSPRKVYLYLGYLCNLSCRYCGLDDSRSGYNFPLPDIERALESLRADPPDIIEISGGEPTMHPEFFRICQKARDCGAGELLVFSNGVKFSDRGFAAKYARLGIENTIITVHGPNAETHDYITRRRGSFLETTAGLAKLSIMNVPTSVKFIVMRRNVARANEWVKLVSSCHEGAHMMFNGLAIWGQAKKEIWELAIRHKEAASFVEQGVDLAAELGHSAGIYFMPPCVFDPTYWERFGIRVFNESVLEPSEGLVGSPLFEECYSHPTVCSNCVMKPRCVWAWKPYSEVYTLDEVVPVLARDTCISI